MKHYTALAANEMFESLAIPQRASVAICGEADDITGRLTIVLGSGTKVSNTIVPGVGFDWNAFQIIDYGHTILFGDQEVDVEAFITQPDSQYHWSEEDES